MRSTWRWAVAAIAATGALVAAAVAAAAHTALIDSDPAADAVVSEISDLTLTFSDEVLEIGIQVSLEAADGTVVELDAQRVGDDQVAAAVPDLDSGVYQVFWRVVAADGHPIDGEYSFTLERAEPTDGPSPSPSASPSASPTERPVASPSPTASPSPSPGFDQEVGQSASAPPVWLALVAAAILTVVWWWLIRRRVSRGEPVLE